jgi:trimeric autotransporter adhesin
MSSTKRKLRLAGAFAALAALALAASCRGFFVKPTISSLAVGPAAPTIQTGSTGNTVQMFAVGTFNDGSTGNPPVSWSIADTSIAIISTNGLVTSVATGSTTVTATSNDNPSITGTQTVAVTVGCIQSITISPTSGNLNQSSPSASFTATANTCNGSADITSVANWVSSNTSIATVAAGVVTATETAGSSGTITITATAGGITSAPVTITVSGF